ncbi:hypothetical protein SELMODRAFT_407571 [Selaginella moellendorffii]|uniref:Uncharacterized protein n=1 Tax=Selaginella moellendorffii TaxID=88036 RepID=D8R613_SELML|nr:hypothetical protein SELMODRAFT_407571 [Selaginella moellendorffii]
MDHLVERMGLQGFGRLKDHRARMLQGHVEAQGGAFSGVREDRLLWCSGTWFPPLRSGAAAQGKAEESCKTIRTYMEVELEVDPDICFLADVELKNVPLFISKALLDVSHECLQYISVSSTCLWLQDGQRWLIFTKLHGHQFLQGFVTCQRHGFEDLKTGVVREHFR